MENDTIIWLGFSYIDSEIINVQVSVNVLSTDAFTPKLYGCHDLNSSDVQKLMVKLDLDVQLSGP